MPLTGATSLHPANPIAPTQTAASHSALIYSHTPLMTPGRMVLLVDNLQGCSRLHLQGRCVIIGSNGGTIKLMLWLSSLSISKGRGWCGERRPPKYRGWFSWKTPLHSFSRFSTMTLKIPTHIYTHLFTRSTLRRKLID